MNVTRRQTIAFGASALAFAALGSSIPTPALASEESDKLIAEFTGGKEATAGKIKLKAPEIAENGNTVPISFKVDSPMTADNHVASVMLLALGNPVPGVGTFNFTAMSGEAVASTRIRLAKTQEVMAFAKMSDGSVFMDKKTVKVTIGGCGG
jgi:sulfur-oxidizing protein SoxY